MGLSAPLVASAAAFAPSRSAPASFALNAGIVDTLSSLEGREIFWGSEGVMEGKDESDIKGYDNFGKFAAALTGAGIDLSSGDFTVLAPTDSAIDAFEGEITAGILKYHIIPGGKKTLDMLMTDQETLQGGTLTSYRKFRKNWLDFAIVGLKSEGPSKSASMPADVEADNGMIQGIDPVLVPGAYTGSR